MVVIGDLILDLLQAVLEFLFGLLPDDLLPDTSSWAAQGATIGSELGYANSFLPFSAAVTGARLILAVWVACRVIELGQWALRRLHILG